jgi:hypothetical protein
MKSSGSGKMKQWLTWRLRDLPQRGGGFPPTVPKRDRNVLDFFYFLQWNQLLFDWPER